MSSRDPVVIVGIDGTERSHDALALGQEIAGALDVALLAVYVHPLEEFADLLTGGTSAVRELLVEAADAAHARVGEVASNMGIDDLRLESASSAAAGLHSVAVEEGARVLVLGSSSQSGVGRLLPGGTGERLLSGSPVAVAVAPRGYAEHQPMTETVGCGFDGSPTSREALTWAADVAGRSRRTLRVIAVHRRVAFGNVAVTGAFGTRSASEELRAELAEDLEQALGALKIDVSVESEVIEGDPAAILADQSAHLGLLVLGSRGFGPVKSVLLGSVSAEVTRMAACPVLVVPSGAERVTGGSDDTPEPLSQPG
jgi:nucleotide-binding universal stress UspA family protein